MAREVIRLALYAVGGQCNLLKLLLRCQKNETGGTASARFQP